MPAKKAPAKKTASRKKNAKNVKRSALGTGFVVKFHQSLIINLKRGTNAPYIIPSGTPLKSGDVLIWRNEPPPLLEPLDPAPTSGTPHFYVEKSGTIGLGFNMPSQGQPPNLNMDLSIFQSLTRDPGSSKTFRASQLDANGLIIFSIGIEG